MDLVVNKQFILLSKARNLLKEAKRGQKRPNFGLFRPSASSTCHVIDVLKSPWLLVSLFPEGNEHKNPALGRINCFLTTKPMHFCFIISGLSELENIRVYFPSDFSLGKYESFCFPSYLANKLWYFPSDIVFQPISFFHSIRTDDKDWPRTES